MDTDSDNPQSNQGLLRTGFCCCRLEVSPKLPESRRKLMNTKPRRGLWKGGLRVLVEDPSSFSDLLKDGSVSE